MQGYTGTQGSSWGTPGSLGQAGQRPQRAHIGTRGSMRAYPRTRNYITHNGHAPKRDAVTQFRGKIWGTICGTV